MLTGIISGAESILQWSFVPALTNDLIEFNSHKQNFFSLNVSAILNFIFTKKKFPAFYCPKVNIKEAFNL